jgi:hypothetical protein
MKNKKGLFEQNLNLFWWVLLAILLLIAIATFSTGIREAILNFSLNPFN